MCMCNKCHANLIHISPMAEVLLEDRDTIYALELIEDMGVAQNGLKDYKPAGTCDLLSR